MLNGYGKIFEKKQLSDRVTGNNAPIPWSREPMRLSTIAREVCVCRRCGLHKGRQKAVPGEGPQGARVILVGEAPGKEEDVAGRPFVGRSGKILDDLLGKAGLRREDLFITSVVKCRPPQNRTPRKTEYSTCIETHLRRQIEAISPVIICLLGGIAVEALLGTNRLSQIRGKVIRSGEDLFFPTYHPAAAGRSHSWHRALSEDLKKLRNLIESEICNP
jgi:DNA polymerase